MNSKNLVLSTALAASMALSAKAALFVGTAAGAAGVSDGVTQADNGGADFNPGPVVVIFTVNTSVSLTGLGAFDQGADGFGGFTWNVQLWENTSGVAGSVVRSASVSGSDTLQGGAFRVASVTPTTLSPGTTYAISLNQNGNSTAGLFSGFVAFGGGDHGYSSTVNGDRAATYASEFVVSDVVVRAPNASIIPSTVFQTGGFTGTGLAASLSGGNVTNIRVVNAEYSAVPEPSTYALIAGAGLVGFGLWRRRAVKA